jgi:hypothetical protein
MTKNTLTPAQAADRLADAGRPTTASTVRRWCAEGFGTKVMGRWCISKERVAELEQELCVAPVDRQ